MERELVVVERDEFPLDALAAYDEEEVDRVMVVFDKTCMDRLLITTNSVLENGSIYMLSWEETDDMRKACTVFKRTDDEYELIWIEAEGIAFHKPSENSNRILFFQMGE